MLSFILSKMNMLIFAVGIFLIAVAFMYFIQGMDLGYAAKNLLQKNALEIQERLGQGEGCTKKAIGIPAFLNYGINGSIRYQIDFEKVSISEGKNQLVLSLKERGAKNTIASQSVITDAEIVLVSPDAFAVSGERPITASDLEPDLITLFPRGDPPTDSYYILKDVDSAGAKKLYIIPCTTYSNLSCNRMLVRVGCYMVKDAASQSTPIPDCFRDSIILRSEGYQNMQDTLQKCTAMGFV